MLKDIKGLKILSKEEQQEFNGGFDFNPFESCEAQASIMASFAVAEQHGEQESFEAHITYMIEYNAALSVCRGIA